MSEAGAAPPLASPLAAFLAGTAVAWPDLRLTPEEVLQRCRADRLTALMHERLQRFDSSGWPQALRDDLAREARAEAARELARANEIAAVLDALAAGGVRPILFKGTALAYTIYPAPSARPRGDTDVLLPREDVAHAREILSAAGYVPAVYCDGELLFRQIELQKTDRLGVVHAWDLHWAVSTQALFADLLSYDEVAREAAPVPALGAHARAASPVHALLLACVHPAMHHRNETSALWTLDVHLLTSEMSAPELTAFARLAAVKRVAAIVAAQLDQAARTWGTALPPEMVAALRTPGGTREPSAEYLRPGRRWHNELLANLRYLPGWRRRLQLLREVTFPSATYMSRAYGVRTSGAAAVLLPGLYAARIVVGLLRLLTRRKL